MSDTAHAHSHAQDPSGEPPLMAHGSVLRTGISNGKIGMWLFLGSEVMFFTGLIGAYIVLRFGQNTWADPLAHDYPLNIPLTAANTFLLICSSVTLVYGLQHIQAGNRGKGNNGLLWTTLFGAVFVGVQAYEYVELWHQTDPVEELPAWGEAQGGKDKEAVAKLHVEMKAYFETAHAQMAGPPGGVFSKPGERWSSGKHPTHRDLLMRFQLVKRDPAQQAVLDRFVTHVGDAEHFHWHNPSRPHSDLFASCFFAMTGFHGLHVFIGVVCMGVLTVMGWMGKFGPDNYAAVELTGLYWHFVDLVWIILFAIVYLM